MFRQALRAVLPAVLAALVPVVAFAQAPAAATPTSRSGSSCPTRRAACPTPWRASSRSASATACGQSVVIDNRPGANGGVAAGVLASGPADGYQFLVTDGSMFSINPLMYSKLTYDPKKDFVPVALIARAPLFLAVNPKMPVTHDAGVDRLHEGAAGPAQLRLVGHRQHAPPGDGVAQVVARPRHQAHPVQGHRAVGAGAGRRPGRDAVLRVSVAGRLREGRPREARVDQQRAALLAGARPSGHRGVRARLRLRADHRHPGARGHAAGDHPEGRR